MLAEWGRSFVQADVATSTPLFPLDSVGLQKSLRVTNTSLGWLTARTLWYFGLDVARGKLKDTVIGVPENALGTVRPDEFEPLHSFGTSSSWRLPGRVTLGRLTVHGVKDSWWLLLAPCSHSFLAIFYHLRLIESLVIRGIKCPYCSSWSCLEVKRWILSPGRKYSSVLSIYLGDVLGHQ